MIYLNDDNGETNAIMLMENDLLVQVTSKSSNIYLLSTPTIRASDILINDTWTL